MATALPPKVDNTKASVLNDNVCLAIGSLLPNKRVLTMKQPTGIIAQVSWRYERTTIREAPPHHQDTGRPAAAVFR